QRRHYGGHTEHGAHPLEQPDPATRKRRPYDARAKRGVLGLRRDDRVLAASDLTTEIFQID
ncbi:MAG TPA: hypothetical protein VH142_01590, partial [Polyangiaceae bacterium]|nr:hypothetical protein [Polyangiaceae bacterium]